MGDSDRAALGGFRVTMDRLDIGRPHIACEDLDGEIIAIDFRNGAYYSLAGTAAEIWRQAIAGSGRTAILDGVTRASADSDAARAATGRFLDELLALGLLHATGGDGSRAAVFAGFQPPLVEKFEDMAELIKLDPIHEVTESGWPHVAAA